MVDYRNYKDTAVRRDRDVYCKSCNRYIFQQHKWKAIASFSIGESEWSTLTENAEDFKYCPFCGEPLYEAEE